ncbi:hypothetical protein [Nocardioides marmorisolisilvae]|uniref:Uncharacterized protein n=1 Tax=Nocardioides marmorisolisilvae TaxID=1542737 RepID=A0A3N0DPD7_9ACTN|nr:hypothetical protein [Nocardioides marmorisolisilvae]RNL77485.1 hypothetical protein EFL95_15785 [Nocardioides marmorisolisilvae]
MSGLAEGVGTVLAVGILYLPGFVFVWSRTFAHFKSRSAVLAVVAATIAGLYWPISILVIALARVSLVGERKRIQRDYSDAPIELVALDVPFAGAISAQRKGEPSFEHVNGVSDAIMAALSRGVDLVIPRRVFEEIRDDLPQELPSYIKIR